MSVSYDAKATEAKWRKRWEESSLYAVDLTKAKDPYYCLVMFPYPSGAKLHVGHWYQYGPTDSFARFMRMRGKDVFFPMGFDAFGLPAENYAIKTGVPPASSTAENVRNMIEQFRRMGCMYDWSKTLNTSEHEYYRWTQWLFLQMHKHGLAYRKRANVNFCPACQTVLAREQCQDGRCERCENEVIQKPLEQWFWQITKYADELLDSLKDLDWPEKTKSMQEHWIGRREGTEIEFGIRDSESKITVFTTRPDTLFGATYIVLAPEHPLIEKITPKNHAGSIGAYQEEVQKKTELQRTDLNKIKTGVWTGVCAINPANKEEIPIWIADYVLMSYGTGAVMAVPSHDERDFEFAKKYKLPLKPVITSRDKVDEAEIRAGECCFTGDGVLWNSGDFSGLKSAEARKRITSWLEDQERGRTVTQYRLKDWLISRQRYWGAPIPIVYDPEGNPHGIPEKHLPWLLPMDVEFKPTGESPLKHSKEFKERTEKIFGKGWIPEYDTMDTFVCSSFYYLRFLMENNAKKFVDPHMESQWMPVSCYIGGPEHACMHLIYARFVMKVLQDLSFVKHREPFKKLVHQGLITNKGAKMSKSKGNVVSPDEFVEKFGSDVFRLYLMFMGPYTEGGDWNDTGIKGMERFVQRIWKVIRDKWQEGSDSAQANSAVKAALHRTIKKVTEDMEDFHFNTAIAALMELLNILEREKSFPREVAEAFVKLLAPLTPHLAEELWEYLGGKGFLLEQKWLTYDSSLLLSETMTIVVQVNGKVRANIEVSSDTSKEEILLQAKKHQNVHIHLKGGQPKNEIYVLGRLVNFVI